MNIQMILALGAMILLSILIINVNKTSLVTEETMYDSSFGILATSLGASVIEEASQKHYDDKTDTLYIDKLADLTTAGNLGTDAGENANDPTSYDDFDDYNDYSRVDSSMPSAIFNISAAVSYVDSLTPETPISTQSWYKKITVTVTSKFMRDTIRQSSIFAYWNFR